MKLIKLLIQTGLQNENRSPFAVTVAQKTLDSQTLPHIPSMLKAATENYTIIFHVSDNHTASALQFLHCRAEGVHESLQDLSLRPSMPDSDKIGYFKTPILKNVLNAQGPSALTKVTSFIICKFI